MPTVTVNPVKPYPTVGEVLQLARVIVNDAFGPSGIKGDLLSSSQPYTETLLDSAFTQLQDELADAGVDVLTKEIVITPAFPVVTLVDPAVTTYISWDGTFDGTVFHTADTTYPQLPFDLIVPSYVWERPTGQSTYFTEVVPWDGGLPGGFQTDKLRWYEWRGDALYFKGATFPTDLKINYLAYLPKLDFVDETLVPIMRSLRAMAYIISSEYARARGSAAADNLYAMAVAEIGKIANRTARRKSVIQYRRKAYGSY